jgi:hypothetical protein
VPNYLTGDGGPATASLRRRRPHADRDALPVQNGTSRRLPCNISDATMRHRAGAPGAVRPRPAGRQHEINAGNVRAFANEHNVVFCATKWAGMSEDDIGNAAATLGEFSQLPDDGRPPAAGRAQPDLPRPADDPPPTASPSDANFQRADGTDGRHRDLDYDGNSQGGIMGLMLAAVSPDIERAVLGVPGMNYSMLLPRSVDFDTYEAIMTPAYPSDLDRC